MNVSYILILNWGDFFADVCIVEANPQQPFNSRSTNISVSALEMRGRLNQEPNSSSQVSLVVNELADLFQQLVPYFRRLGNILTADTTVSIDKED